MTSRNRKLVKENDKDKKDKKTKKTLKGVMSKIDGVIKKYEWILLLVALACTGFIDYIFITNWTGGVLGYIVVIYLSALCILILLLLAAEFIPNVLPNYKDSTWSSYVLYVVVMLPFIVITVYAGIINKWNPAMDIACLLQAVYWSIAGSNLIWFLFHIIFVKDCEQRKKLNSFLKLMVVIISGIGLVMDIVAQINFTYQFLAIAWTVLLMSYISDRMADQS